MNRLPACLALLAVTAAAGISPAADEPPPATAPATARSTTAPAAVAPLDLGDGVRLELVRVPAGTFKMGSPPTEDGRRPDEEQVDARIDGDFDLGKFPVTRGQFARFVKATGHRTEAEVGTSGGFGWNGSALVQQKAFNWKNPGFAQTDDHPVVLVTYNDAKAFCAWASRVTGRRVTLPTERQWELACRGGTSSRYYTGDAPADADRAAWHKGNAGNGTRPVGQKAANPLGLFDLSGNVFEWCDDAYGPYTPGGPVQKGSDDGKVRKVLRGGSWARDPADVRSAARYRNTPGSRNADNGFRVAVALAPAAPPAPAAGAEVPPVTTPPPPSSEEYGPSSPIRPAPAADGPAPVGVGTHDAPAVESGGVSWFACLAFAFVPVALIAVVVLLVRRMGRRASATFGGSTSPAPGFAAAGFGNPGVGVGGGGGGVRPADDGFWIDTAGYPAGSVVRYSYRGPSGPVSQQFTVEPSPQGQFVYTGHRPHDLTLAGVAAGAVGGAAAGYLLAEQERRRREEAEEAARRATRSSYTSHTRPSSSHPSRSSFGGHPSAY